MRPTETKSELTKNNKYECPVHKTVDRSGLVLPDGENINYITSVHLECSDSLPAKHWILRDCFLTCQTSTQLQKF